MVPGDLVAKERAVLGAILMSEGEPLPPACADLVAHPGLWLSDPHCRVLAARIGNLISNGFPVAPATLLAEDKTGLVKELMGQSALVLSAAEIEAATIKEHAAARLIAEHFQGIQEKVLEKPDTALAVASDAIDALRGVIDHATGRKGLTVRSPDEILALPTDPTENLLGARLLTRGGQLVIAGAGGVGKSRMALQLAASVIAGREFLGLASYGRGTRWLFIQAENDNERLKTDLGALRQWLGGDWPLVQPHLWIHTLESELDTMLALDDETTASAVRRLLDQQRPDVVVWDSLYSFAAGDLNKDADMRAALTRIHQVSRHRNPKRAIVVLHHATTGKAGAAKATGLDRASFGRNSKVLHSWARGQINVAPLSTDSNDLLAIACGKASNGREFPKFAARLHPERLVYEVAPEVDVDETMEEALGGKPSGPAMTSHEVADLAPGKSKPELVRAIRNAVDCSQATAYRLIETAEREGVIRLHRTSGTYQDIRPNP
ncbi:MAG: AAA family ATPase [Verrucomicrobiae bacterium]|nr:AAA family ATPase [Verrucomicrobiae bacterium]